MPKIFLIKGLHSMIFNNIIKSILLLILIATLFNSNLHAKDKNILAYKDRGIKYYPHYVRKGLVKITKASWYGKPFHGRLTANGERYNMYGMTAAHKTYAMGTRLKITNLTNKRSVKVRVNDRGPFYSSRKIDLSYGAAKRLGMIHKGVSRVKIEVISSHGRKSKKTKYAKKSKHTKKIAKKSKFKKKVLIAKSKKVIKRLKKIQLASFSSKKQANSFKRKHNLKNVVIVKKYIKDQKKTAYRVVINCTSSEAKKLLKSKKFIGAYKVS